MGLFSKNTAITIWNKALAYIAFVLFYLDDTQFTTPLIDIMHSPSIEDLQNKFN